jgi:molybdenum-dependent DNA-binding transcriptional regulator ModE
MPKDLWLGLEMLSIQAGVMLEWRREMGPDFDACARFLAPTPRLAASYPCTSPVCCHCRHRVQFESADVVCTVCQCGECSGEPVQIPIEDLVVHALDGPKLGAAIREAFGFSGAVALSASQREARQLGTWGGCRTPVYFYIPISEGKTLVEIERLDVAARDPYVLLTPTDRFCGARVQGALRRSGSAQLGLAGIVKVRETGAMRLAEQAAIMVDTVFGEVQRRRLTRPDSALILREIHREIAAVRAEHHELRAAKARLEEMQAQGLFKFTQKVEPKSFRILCAVLAEGDISKAARTLEMPDSSLRALIAAWPRQGGPYAVMADLVRWRKTVGRAQIVPLNDAILTERADTVDYPGLIADILDGILSMTDTNWEDKAQELAEMLRPIERG